MYVEVKGGVSKLAEYGVIENKTTGQLMETVA